MNRDAAAVTETTPEGLAALIYHIAHGASQGQLDPEFVRKLGKRVDKELEAMEAAEQLTAADKEQLLQAVQTLQRTADVQEGARLTRALDRLRKRDAQPPQPQQPAA